MSPTIDMQLVDEAMDAYIDWRELCCAVQDAYERWARAPRSRMAAAFREYTMALDAEERSSLEYRLLIECIVP
jgi:hypothetical protein